MEGIKGNTAAFSCHIEKKKKDGKSFFIITFLLGKFTFVSQVQLHKFVGGFAGHFHGVVKLGWAFLNSPPISNLAQNEPNLSRLDHELR